ncbi:MAG: ABC transporter permease, partial [Chromatiales bacterium]|nr:ABC transporter permease [Chromatiales bacterium]
MPVIFWTDALLFALFAAVLVFAAYARRHPHLRAPWGRVARGRTAMGSAVVLAVFVAIGLLDSVHFHPRDPKPGPNGETVYEAGVLSLLDWWAEPLRTQVEKTYSAPFAIRSYAKESTETAGGSVRLYPRLRYGGAHLAGPEERGADIRQTVLLALAQGLIVWLWLAGSWTAWLARRSGQAFRVCLGRVWRNETEVPWRTILLTLGAVILLGFLAARLGVRYHILGTDKVGQDVFYLALKSVRTGLAIGTLTTLVMLPLALLLGLAAGYFRGWADDLIQYLYTTLNSIPSVLLIAAAILILQVYMATHLDSGASLEERADLRLLFLCIILGVTSWTGLCRLLRAETLKLRESDYIQAARAFGVSHFTILMRHVLPNVMHIVLITVVLDFSGLVLAEAVLSYVNIGVDPTMASWGNMINAARLEMAREPMVWWSLAAA